MTGLLSPALALAVVLSTAYAALFHLWQRGDMRALWRYLVSSWIGFGLGHVVSGIGGVQWLQIGQLNITGGTAGALLALLIARYLEA